MKRPSVQVTGKVQSRRHLLVSRNFYFQICILTKHEQTVFMIDVSWVFPFDSYVISTLGDPGVPRKAGKSPLSRRLLRPSKPSTLQLLHNLLFPPTRVFLESLRTSSENVRERSSAPTNCTWVS